MTLGKVLSLCASVSVSSSAVWKPTSEGCRVHVTALSTASGPSLVLQCCSSCAGLCPLPGCEPETQELAAFIPVSENAMLGAFHGVCQVYESTKPAPKPKAGPRGEKHWPRADSPGLQPDSAIHPLKSLGQVSPVPCLNLAFSSLFPPAYTP